MSAGNLREQLHEAMDWQDPQPDDLIPVIAAWLTSDATVERVARALFDNGQRFCEWDQLPKNTRRRQCDRARAALAAAMAEEGDDDA